MPGCLDQKWGKLTSQHRSEIDQLREKLGELTSQFNTKVSVVTDCIQQLEVELAGMAAKQKKEQPQVRSGGRDQFEHSCTQRVEHPRRRGQGVRVG